MGEPLTPLLENNHCFCAIVPLFLFRAPGICVGWRDRLSVRWTRTWKENVVEKKGREYQGKQWSQSDKPTCTTAALRSLMVRWRTNNVQKVCITLKGFVVFGKDIFDRWNYVMYRVDYGVLRCVEVLAEVCGDRDWRLVTSLLFRNGEFVLA